MRTSEYKLILRAVRKLLQGMNVADVLAARDFVRAEHVA